MKSDPPKGQIYSRLYAEREAPLPDSPRMRARLSQYFWDFLMKHNEEIRKGITRELGADLPETPMLGGMVPDFFRNNEVRDVIDAITLIHRFLEEYSNRTARVIPLPPTAPEWRAFVRRVFQEENLAYSLDDKGGVHPLIDAEFSRNVTATVRGLGSTRHVGSRAAFERAQAKLEQTPADLKGAIRDLFEATETLTKLISGSGQALDASFVRKELEPRVQRLYESDVVGKQSGARMCSSFADWIDAAHPYRHGQRTMEPVEPPADLAVLIVSQGASFLRWLIDLDQQVN